MNKLTQKQDALDKKVAEIFKGDYKAHFRLESPKLREVSVEGKKGSLSIMQETIKGGATRSTVEVAYDLPPYSLSDSQIEKYGQYAFSKYAKQVTYRDEKGDISTSEFDGCVIGVDGSEEVFLSVFNNNDAKRNEYFEHELNKVEKAVGDILKENEINIER